MNKQNIFLTILQTAITVMQTAVTIWMLYSFLYCPSKHVNTIDTALLQEKIKKNQELIINGFLCLENDLNRHKDSVFEAMITLEKNQDVILQSQHEDCVHLEKQMFALTNELNDNLKIVNSNLQVNEDNIKSLLKTIHDDMYSWLKTINNNIR